MIALGITGTITWQAQARVRRLSRSLAETAASEAEQLADLGERLNRHGFDLQHTFDELAPKVKLWSNFLNQPLVAATLPWLLRRALGRPFKRGG